MPASAAAAVAVQEAVVQAVEAPLAPVEAAEGQLAAAETAAAAESTQLAAEGDAADAGQLAAAETAAADAEAAAEGQTGGTAADTTAEAEALEQQAEEAAPSRGVWDQGPGPRGEAIEARLGQNLPQNYPTIDRFENGVATSIKSMDLANPTYLNPANITRLGEDYIDKVAAFQGRNWAGVNIRPGDITGRGLDLAVPPATATPAQLQALQGLVNYGAQHGVNVTIVEIE